MLHLLATLPQRDYSVRTDFSLSGQVDSSMSNLSGAWVGTKLSNSSGRAEVTDYFALCPQSSAQSMAQSRHSLIMFKLTNKHNPGKRISVPSFGFLVYKMRIIVLDSDHCETKTSSLGLLK